MGLIAPKHEAAGEGWPGVSGVMAAAQNRMWGTAKTLQSALTRTVTFEQSHADGDHRQCRAPYCNDAGFDDRPSPTFDAMLAEMTKARLVRLAKAIEYNPPSRATKAQVLDEINLRFSIPN